MKKNIIHSILFTIIFFILYIGFAYLFAPKNNIFKYDIFTLAGHEILSEKENSIDIIFLGDSLTYSGISPIDLWNEYGYTSFDYAYPAQKISISYEELKLALKVQKPKVVMLEANVLMRDSTKAPFGYTLLKWQDSFLPLQTYHNNWKKILFPTVKDSLRYSWINPTKGFKYVPKIQSGNPGGYMDEEPKAVIPNDNFDYLEKMYNLCKENDIEFILISTPNGKSWNFGKYLAARDASNKLGISYIELNLLNPLSINWNKETKDNANHLNYAGSLKVTRYIGNYLKTRDLVEDHRNDSDYDDWNKAYEIFEKEIKKYE